MEHILKFEAPENEPERPWETFPDFVAWCNWATKEDAVDKLLGIRTGMALSGVLGQVGVHISAALIPENDEDIIKEWIKSEVGRLMMTVGVLSEFIGYNPLKELVGSCDQYVIRSHTAYGFDEPLPFRERAYIWMNVFTRMSGHLLPITYAVGLAEFTDNPVNPGPAAQELLAGVHEIHTLLDSFDTTMSECLEQQVRAIREDLQLGIGERDDDDS